MQATALRKVLDRLPAFATRCLAAGLALVAAIAATNVRAGSLIYAPHDDGTVTSLNSANGLPLGAPFITGLTGPFDIARNPQGEFIVALAASNKVAKYSASGALVNDRLFSIGAPPAVAVAPDGLIYVASGSRVAVYGPTGALVATTFIDGLEGPVDLAIDYKGEVLYVAESTGNVVSAYSLLTGAVINEALVSVVAPRAVAISHSGSLYVAAGVSVTRHDAATGAAIPAFSLTGLATPSRLAINNNDNTLYVGLASGGLRVVPVDLGTGAVLNPIYLLDSATDSAILVQESGAQTIYVPEDSDITLTSLSPRLRATSTSGLPVRYEILSGFEFVNPLADASPTEPNAFFIPQSTGTVTVRVTQAGNANFSAATPVEFSFDVIKTPQTITFTDIADFTIGGASVLAQATATSGLGVTFTVDGPATLSGSLIKPTAGGTLTITASQPGNDRFAPAPDVVQVVEVLKKTQAITFADPGPRSFGDAPFTLDATSDSGLAVTIQVSGPATLNGRTLTITGPGDITLTASQAGNGTFSPAADVVRMLSATSGLQTISFPTQSLTLGGAPVVLSATASSGLPVSYTYISGPGVLDGSTLTANGVGTIVIEATQAGDASFGAATPVQGSFTVGPRGNVINFPALPDATFGDAPITLGATATSGLTVAYSVISGPATVLGNQLTLTGSGPVVVEATQPGASGIVAASPVRRSLNVAKAAQTITFPELDDATFGDDPVALAATATSGLGIVYSLDAGSGSLSGSALTLLGAGTYQVRASQPGNSRYLAAEPVVRTLVVAKLAQLVTFAALPDRTYAFPQPSFNLSATAASGLPVTFSVVEGPATVQGSVLTLTGAGSVTIRATQAGNPNYLAAEPVDRTFTTAKAAQTIAFSPPATRTFSDVGVTLGGTASSGLPLAYEIVSGPATVSEGVLTFTGAGSVVVRASQIGNADWLAAASVERTITASRAPQAITFAAPADILFTDPAFDLVATSTSALPVAFTLVSGPASLEGTTLTPTGTGTVLVRATQAGNDDFLAASAVQRSFRIVASAQTITFAELPGRTFGDAPFALSATASSELPVAFSLVSGPATLAGSTLTLTGAGTVTVRASQRGNSAFIAAPPIERSFTVAKAAQTIDFAALEDRLLGTSATPLVAVSDAGLPVSFQLVSGPATLDGASVTPTATGLITVRAIQEGNADYLAASPVERSFAVDASPAEVVLGSLAQTYNGTPRAVTATTVPAGLDVVVTYAAPGGEPTTTPPVAAGSYAVTATITTEGNIGSATGTLVIAKAPLVVTARDEVKLVGTANPSLSFAYSGFVGGDTEAALVSTPVVATSAVKSSPVGQYPITLVGGSAINYSLVLVPGVLRVVTFSGPYETLLYSSAPGFGEARLPVGKVEVTVPATGTRITGRLLLTEQASALSFSGNLALSDEQSAAFAIIPIVGKPSTERYTLTLSVGASGLAVSLAKNEAVIATADAADATPLFVSAPNRPAPWAGAHTLIFDSPRPVEKILETSLPRGSGYATANISTAGLLTLTGRLPDGTALSGTARAGVDGSFRVFIKPYGTRLQSHFAGLLTLELHPDINNRYVSASSTSFVWTKAPGARDPSYRAGIPLLGFEGVTLDPWLPTVRATALAPAIVLADRLGLDFESTVVLDFEIPAETTTELPEVATLTSANRIVPVGENPAAFSLAVTPATGLFTGKVTVRYFNGSAFVSRAATFSGILRQPTVAEALEGDALVGAGFITLPGVPAASTGAIRLFTPPAPGE